MKTSPLMNPIKLLYLTIAVLLLPFVQIASAQDNGRIVTAFYVNPAAMFTTAGTSTTSSSDVVKEIIAGSTMPQTTDENAISLVPSAGRGTSYVEQPKHKYHESKHEFEKHLKQKQDKRFTVSDFDVKQTDHGLKGRIDIIENKNDQILQLSTTCTEAELSHRIDIAKAFMLNNPELIGFSENEELRVKRYDKLFCDHLYFDRYVNGYLLGTSYHFVFRPEDNFSILANIDPITPEMFAATQQPALNSEEVIKIILKEMNFPLDSPNRINLKELPNFRLSKYLLDKAPYAIWQAEVNYAYIYTINALTGEIISKHSTKKY